MIRSLWRLGLTLACLALAGTAGAQTTSGTISGRVIDGQGLPLPGVTINAASPNLQGVRASTTSANGDYTFIGLPSGQYKLTFELSGFQTIEKTVTLAPTETLTVDSTLGVAAVSETVNVVADQASVLTQTAQVATNFKQDLVAMLPTNRDINASLLLAPAVHPTGPSGAYSIAGAMSFESLFMVNGVNVSENLRGQANDLYIEDAIQETHVATAGISAEYGRFGGGVVNVITKSGGNLFSGSLRDTLNNDHWRTLTPFETTQIAADPAHKELRIDKTIPTYEYTLGGPILKDHLWFFTAGRLQTQQSGRSLVITNVPYTYTDKTRRFEEKGTYSLNPNQTFQGSYTKIIDNQTNDTFNTSASMDTRSLDNRQLPQDLSTGSYNGVFGSHFTVEGRISSRHFSFIGSGAPSTDLIDGTLLLDRQRGNTRFWSPTFCGICDPERRDNTDVFGKGTYFLSTKNGGSHNIVFGYDLFNDKRFANNHQSGSDYRIFATTSFIQGTDVVPQFLGDGTTIIQWNPIPQGSEGTNFRTHSTFVNDNWRVTSRLTANVGLRYDKNHGADSAGRLVAKDSAFSPRVGVSWDPDRNADLERHRQLRQVRLGDLQQHRRLIVGRRESADLPVHLPRSVDQRHRTGDADRRRDQGGVRLVQRQRRRQPAAGRRADDSRRHAGHSGLAQLAEQPRIRRRPQPAARQPRNRPRRLRLPRLPRLLRHGAGHHDRQGPGQPRQDLRPGADPQLQRSAAALLRATRAGHLPVLLDAGHRRHLYPVAHLGQQRRRERRQRPGHQRRVRLSGIQAGGLELPDRGSIDRSAPPRPHVGDLRAAVGPGAYGQRAADGHQRRALRGDRSDRHAALCHQPRLRHASVQHRVDRHQLLLHRTRCVPHQGGAPYRSVGQLQLRRTCAGQGASIRAAAGDQPLQPVPAVRLRRRRSSPTAAR